MGTRYTITYKSGREQQLVDYPTGGSPGAGIRREFEKYLKDGKQAKFLFQIRDHNGQHANTNVELSIDFRDVSSVLMHEI